MSRKRQEKPSRFYDRSAKIDGNQTNPKEERKQHLTKVVYNEAQTHSQKPFADHETSS